MPQLQKLVIFLCHYFSFFLFPFVSFFLSILSKFFSLVGFWLLMCTHVALIKRAETFYFFFIFLSQNFFLIYLFLTSELDAAPPY